MSRSHRLFAIHTEDYLSRGISDLVSTVEKETSESIHIEIRCAITHADSPSSLIIPTSSLSAAWDHWEPMCLIFELLGREQPHPTADHLDRVDLLLETLLVPSHIGPRA